MVLALDRVTSRGSGPSCSSVKQRVWRVSTNKAGPQIDVDTMGRAVASTVHRLICALESTQMSLDPEKARARRRRYNDRQKVKKYGADAAGRDMRGRHGRHATGEKNARWNRDARRFTAHGYAAVRVQPNHPHAWGPLRLKRFKYAYEHVVAMMSHLGRPLCTGEVIHHKNGDKTDNRIENLELTSPSEHQHYHTTMTRNRDSLGRFA